MANNIKKKNNQRMVGVSTHCTSYGVLQLLPLQHFKPPPALKAAYKNYKLEDSKQNSLSKDYIELINSFPHVKKIEPKNYLVLFKIFLYLETFEFQLRASKHNLKKQTLRLDLDNFVINVPTLEEDDPFITIGDFVKIENEVSKDKHYAKIIDIKEKDIYVQIKNPKMKDKVEGNLFDIKFCPSNWPIKCCHYALNFIHENNLICALYPKTNTSYSAASKVEFDWINKNIKNNPEQKQAVINIVNNTACPAPYILFGPPGTGKTMTLVEAICQIRKRHVSKNILVCTSSNAAADEIMKRLLEIIPSKDIFRIYSPSKNGEDIDKKVSPCTNFVNNTCIFLPKDIFILKKIVITTLIACTRLARLNLKSDHFSYVFIDEAGQNIEVESLIPITLVSSLNKNGQGSLHAQVILAGDPYQLGPTIWCKEIEHLLGQSLLERLMKSKLYQKDDKNQYNPHYITKLVLNFRSQQPILHVSNNLFYNKEVICTQKSNLKLVFPNLTRLNMAFPISFIQCNGKEMYSELRSVYNEQEIKTVCNFVSTIMSATLGTRKVQENDIGIITPFKQQKIMIQKELYKRNIRNIAVGTVEIFQGQEKEIIIISTVRSKVFKHDGKTHIGFLSNPKRFNVAVTRAKNYLVVIGNPKILCEDSCWKALWDYCNKHNACVTILR
ncbi:putative helicase mov-10-B.1 [Halictus rubicundus]|uniref:putative helicase mov-10-B.1 n=1 Tax=Halictus rubicundus TaxID=77578 RepID=UPI0040367575